MDQDASSGTTSETPGGSTAEPDVLGDTVRTTHELIERRLRRSVTTRPTHDRPRERFTAIDPFLASTSRHLAAANVVIAPACRRHVTGGAAMAHDFAQQSKRLEAALAEVKGKLYGSTFNVRRSWASIWAEVTREWAQTRRCEQAMVDALAAATDSATRATLADRLFATEKRVPTRPHPHLPHQGFTGAVARTVALRVDRFWDTAEGRMVPEPVRPHGARGRMTQYLLAESNHPDL